MTIETRRNAMHNWERIEYPIRVAWYRAKLALGIEPISDKNFLPHDFAMRLERGILPRNARFTIAGRNDGIGMQAMARLSGLHFAHIYGAKYVDTPFSQVGHISEKGLNTIPAWEELLNLGKGEEPLAGRQSQILDYADYISNRKAWRPDSILRFQQFFWLYRRHPDLLDESAHIFQAKYNWPEPSSRRVFTVAVHVRRGDVGKNKNSLRYTRDDRILRAVGLVEETLSGLNLPYQITVHSQGERKDFSEFIARGYDLNLEDNAIIAMQHLIESDVLIMAKSSFSYLAALYNRGVKLYEPTFNPCLPSWISRKSDGRFDMLKFRHVLQTRFGSSPVI